MKVGLIGLGNMAGAMLAGMLSKGIVEAGDVIGSDSSREVRLSREKEFGIRVTEDNLVAAESVQVLILAVKPQILPGVMEQIRDRIQEDTLVISIAAGKTLKWLEECFGRPVKLVRSLPNTPALVGEGCSGVCGNAMVSGDEMKTALKILGSFGLAREVPEEMMDAVLAVSSSAPAYIFMLIEAMADGGVAAGMPRAMAYEFASQTVLGSARMVLETGKHPGELKDMVCSPGGTTIQAVKVLEKKGLRSCVLEAMEACINKSKQL